MTMAMTIALAVTITTMLVTLAMSAAMTFASMSMMAIRTVMMRTVTRCVVIGVPAILHKIHALAARVVFAAVFRPLLGMTGRYAQIDRLLFDVAYGAFNDDRFRVDDARLRHIADIDAAVKIRVADTDGYADVGRHCRRCECQREQAGCKNQFFHDEIFRLMKQASCAGLVLQGADERVRVI